MKDNIHVILRVRLEDAIVDFSCRRMGSRNWKGIIYESIGDALNHNVIKQQFIIDDILLVLQDIAHKYKCSEHYSHYDYLYTYRDRSVSKKDISNAADCFVNLAQLLAWNGGYMPRLKYMKYADDNTSKQEDV